MNTPVSFRAAPPVGQYRLPGKAGCAADSLGHPLIPSRSVDETPV